MIASDTTPQSPSTYRDIDIPDLSKHQIDVLMEPIYLRGNRLVRYFLLGHSVIAFGLAFFYSTWLVTLVATAGALGMFFIAERLHPLGFITRVMAGLSLQTFVILHIYQLHGLAEMHFFFFTAFTMLIVYQDWLSMWPGTLLIIGQHLAFAIFHNMGVPLYFFEDSYIGITKLVFHFGIAASEVCIAGYWAYLLRRRTIREYYRINEYQKLSEERQQFLTAQSLLMEQEKGEEEKNKIIAQMQQEYLEESTRLILDAMQRFAFGDLTVRVESNGREDDINKIFIGFNRSVASVRDLVQQVIQNVEHTNTIAAHISSASNQMAATSQEQAAQVTQIASSVEEMAQSVSENAQQTLQVSSITTQNGTNATEGAQVVDSAVKKIDEIANVVSSASSVVEKLGNSSAEIGEIVQVIEEIADQTNLLALNAAIEAARAGEQGRGFAVVADEVRKLAERTATATKQISQTIKQIQRDTDQAVAGMKRGDSEVHEGLALAKQAKNALQGIVSGSQEVQSMVQRSAGALQQQSSTAEEIARSIEQVSSSVNETTSSLSEIARATEKLRGSTEHLQGLVSQFDVGEISPAVRQINDVSMKRLVS